MATASILNVVVPGRRREKRRQKALEASLDSRWGDASITGPILGGWIQPTTVAEPVKRHGVSAKAVHPSTDSTTKTLSKKRSQKAGPLPKPSHDRLPLSIRILPELEKDDNFAEECLSPFTPRDDHSFSVHLEEEKGNGWISCQTIPEVDEVETTGRQTSPPPVVYKPASGQYLKELHDMTTRPSRHASPLSNANATSNSTVTFKPASEDYVYELNSMGNGFSRSQTPNMAPSQNVPSASRMSPTPKDLFTPPDIVPRAASSPPSRNQLGNPRSVTSSPRLENVLSTQAGTNFASLPPRPRTSSDNSSHMPNRQRSISTNTYRSNSPAPIRIIHKQTETPIDLRDLSQFGLIKEPNSSNLAPKINPSLPSKSSHRRSSSVPATSPRSPPSIPSTSLTSTTVSESMSPTSRTPASPPLDSPPVSLQPRRIPLGSSTMSRRESLTSDPGSTVTSVTSTTNTTNSLSPTSTSHLSARLSSSSNPSSTSPSTGAGYYSSLAGEYKRIARDVEEKAFSEQERERERRFRSTAKKDREKGTYYGPQTLVPKGTDLWG